MKEYRIEGKIKGRWLPTGNPYYNHARIFKTKDAADDELSVIKGAWERHARIYNTANIPKEFRIVSRDVTEWEEVYAEYGEEDRDEKCKN